MTLATHAIVGGLTGALTGGAGSALLVGFVSHFVLDALPHWDYPLRSRIDDSRNRLNDRLVGGPAWRSDLVRIGLDLLLGAFMLALAIFFRPALIWLLVAGAFGGILPDGFQFLYLRYRLPLLRRLQLFHLWVHTETRLRRWPVLGVFSQLALIAVAWWATIGQLL